MFKLKCKQADSPAIDQRTCVTARQVAVKGMYKEAQKTKTQYTFRTGEDYNGNFLDGLERRKQKKIKFPTSSMAAISPASRRETGLETTLASIPTSIQASIKASIGLDIDLQVMTSEGKHC